MSTRDDTTEVTRLADEVIGQIRALGTPENAAGMARFGIRPATTVYGVSVVNLRTIARPLKRNPALAERLWESGVHEARIVATLVADPKQFSAADADRWAASFDSWDLVDQCCGNLLCRVPFAYDKVVAWSDRPEEFVRRAAFSLIAYLATHDKKAADARFEPFFSLIRAAATDERNFVKKAVNWALRGLGKRNLALNARAIETAREIGAIPGSKVAKWIASDTLRELTGEKVQTMLASGGRRYTRKG